MTNNPQAFPDETYIDVQRFAYKKHEGQTDDNGDIYFYHLANVVQILKQVTDSPIVIKAGWLHDTLEDTNTTLEELIENFGQEVANLVHEVTHEGNKTDGYYFPRLKSKDAILIKFADRLSNLSRMEQWSEKRREHYLKRSKFWKSDMLAAREVKDVA